MEAGSYVHSHVSYRRRTGVAEGSANEFDGSNVECCVAVGLLSADVVLGVALCWCCWCCSTGSSRRGDANEILALMFLLEGERVVRVCGMLAVKATTDVILDVEQYKE